MEQFAFGGDAQHDVFNAALQVLFAGSETKDGHQF